MGDLGPVHSQLYQTECAHEHGQCDGQCQVSDYPFPLVRIFCLL